MQKNLNWMQSVCQFGLISHWGQACVIALLIVPTLCVGMQPATLQRCEQDAGAFQHEYPREAWEQKIQKKYAYVLNCTLRFKYIRSRLM